MVFYVMSITYDCSLWIIYAVSDIGRDCSQGSPGGYFLYAKGANVSKTMSLVFPSQPELSRYKLSTMTPMNIKARDGEDIMCYLSSPPESEKSPLVLFVHGGPQARDHWGYNPVCQLLCNRGFRVLQVRVSTPHFCYKVRVISQMMFALYTHRSTIEAALDSVNVS